MSRSKWKGPFLGFLNTKNLLKTSTIKTFSRSTVIFPHFIGITLGVHNGNSFTKVLITKKMVGKKLGEFSPTRKTFSFKKKK